MRYVTMLTNSLIGGAIGAAYFTILILHLNPELPLRAGNIASIYLALELTYGLHLAVVFYILMVLRQLIAFDARTPRWVSFGVLTWLSMLAASGAAALMWLNRRTYGPMLLSDTARRMATGAGWMTACAALFLVLALVHYSFGRKGGRVAGGLFVLALIASLSLPLAPRGFGLTAPARRPAPDVKVTPPAGQFARVSLILLDGASLNLISLAAAEGRLPNLGKILDGGAAMYLATLRPTQPGPVWTAVATGKMPTSNGVRSAARHRAGGADLFDVLPDYCFSHALVRYGVISEQPHTAASVRALPLWDIFSRLGMSVGIVGWPLSHPVHAVRGYIVSDQLHLNHLSETADDAQLLYPVDTAEIARAALETVQSGADSAANRPVVGSDQASVERYLFGTDRVYEQMATRLRETVQPQVSAIRYRGLDRAGHDFLRYADPRSFGDVSEEERRAFGGVLLSAYSVVDDRVGRALADLGPDDLLLVISGFGMEPLGIGKRLLERAFGNAEVSGTHEGGPDGFLLAYGAAVNPGRRTRAALVDVLPTLLYFFGLPVARDMDGYARTDLFRKSFTEDRPITFIPTYER